MSKTVSTTIDGQTITFEVDELSGVEKMKLAAEAPGDLTQIHKANTLVDLSPELVEFLIDVTKYHTSVDNVDSILIDELICISAATLEEIFSEDDDNRNSGRRLKRVRLTTAFIEALFRGGMGIVAGMPDDVSFEDFEFKPERNVLHFIFSSEEWEEIPEGGEIPEFEVYGIGFDNEQ